MNHEVELTVSLNPALEVLLKRLCKEQALQTEDVLRGALDWMARNPEKARAYLIRAREEQVRQVESSTASLLEVTLQNPEEDLAEAVSLAAEDQRPVLLTRGQARAVVMPPEMYTDFLAALREDSIQ